MDAERLAELFAGTARVRIRRMFGGLGVFEDDRMFGLAMAGELFLKADAETLPAFRQADSEPFSFMRNGRRVETHYWRIPPEALDEPELFRRWSDLARAAAARFAS